MIPFKIFPSRLPWYLHRCLVFWSFTSWQSRFHLVGNSNCHSLEINCIILQVIQSILRIIWKNYLLKTFSLTSSSIFYRFPSLHSISKESYIIPYSVEVFLCSFLLYLNYHYHFKTVYYSIYYVSFNLHYSYCRTLSSFIFLIALATSHWPLIRLFHPYSFLWICKYHFIWLSCLIWLSVYWWLVLVKDYHLNLTSNRFLCNLVRPDLLHLPLVLSSH